MNDDIGRDSTGSNPTAVESLEMLLDYAIAEGTELRLPVFVRLLRMASLELAKGAPKRVRGDSARRAPHRIEERAAP